MRTGKLNISRGHRQDEGAAEPRLVLVPKAEGPSAQALPAAEGRLPGLDSHRLNDRLTALERLAALRVQGLLTEAEYAAEKALVRGIDSAPDAQEARQDPSRAYSARRQGPSLTGRLFSLKLVPIGMVAGLALSFGTQPRQTMRWFEQAVAFIGA
jgi:hypothetical protein